VHDPGVPGLGRVGGGNGIPPMLAT
jgi:hypothetical protein